MIRIRGRLRKHVLACACIPTGYRAEACSARMSVSDTACKLNDTLARRFIRSSEIFRAHNPSPFASPRPLRPFSTVSIQLAAFCATVCFPGVILSGWAGSFAQDLPADPCIGGPEPVPSCRTLSVSMPASHSRMRPTVCPRESGGYLLDLSFWICFLCMFSSLDGPRRPVPLRLAGCARVSLAGCARDPTSAADFSLLQAPYRARSTPSIFVFRADALVPPAALHGCRVCSPHRGV